MKIYNLFLFFLLFSFTSYAQSAKHPIIVQDLCKTCPPNYWLQYGGIGIYNNLLVVGLADDPSNNNRMWTYSGSGTLIAVDPTAFTTWSINNTYSNNFTELNGIMYYEGWADTSFPTTAELCKWDGVNVPQIVKDLNPQGFSTYPAAFSTLNNKLYMYAGMPGQHNSYLVEYDPQNDSVRNFILPNPGNGPKLPFDETMPYKNRVYIVSGVSPNRGLYECDPAKDTLNKLRGLYNDLTSPSYPIVHNNTMYFTANAPGVGRGLYAYYGQDTAVRLVNIPGVNNPPGLGWKNLIVYKDNLHINTDTSTQLGTRKSAMFTYDFQTKQLNTVPTFGPTDSFNYFITVYKNKLLVQMRNITYIYDGINVDTVHPVNFSPLRFVEYKGELYMTGTTPEYGYDLYRFNDSLLSMQSVTLDANITLYPNPSGNSATISIDLPVANTLTAVVTDITGKTVYKTKSVLYSTGKSEIPLLLHNLSPGNYIVSLKDSSGNMLWSGKLVHQ